MFESRSTTAHNLCYVLIEIMSAIICTDANCDNGNDCILAIFVSQIGMPRNHCRAPEGRPLS